MHISSIVVGAAIALAATVGSAYAADQFSTLEGIQAATMSAGEMAVVVGQATLTTGKLSPVGTNIVAAPDAALFGAETAINQIVAGPAQGRPGMNLTFTF